MSIFVFLQLYIFESIFRTSAGLNPLQTETLFEYAIQQSKSVIQTKEGKA